eukprot:509330_1
MALTTITLFLIFINRICCTVYTNNDIIGKCLRDVFYLPCMLGPYILIPTENRLFNSGSFGNLYKVKLKLTDGSLYPLTYALKITVSETDIFNDRIKEETHVTAAMYKVTATDEYINSIKCLFNDTNFNDNEDIIYPSIRCFYADHFYHNHKYYSAMLLEYHKGGDLQYIQHHTQYHLIALNRDKYMFKFLFDASFVLQKLWKYNCIYREAKLLNYLIAGDITDFRKTTFVTIDYGQVISIQYAQYELSTEIGRRHSFCQHGTHASPIDVQILYETERKSILAAMVLHNNLESNDIIDLIATAADFYDLLCKSESDKIGFMFGGESHSEKSRRSAVEHNY